MIQPLLKVEGATPGETIPELKVMQYNVLAQSLIRRESYPSNGRYIRWSCRSQDFVKQMQAHAPHILFMQEVDECHNSFWQKLLTSIGMACRFYSHYSKKHGLCIGWNSNLLRWEESEKLDYDSVATENLPRQCKTGNVAFIATLTHLASQTRLIVATTHLYWNPSASYERCRQMLILQRQLHSACTNAGTLYVLVGGDFNVEPFDPAYELGTGAATLSPEAQAVLEESINCQYFGLQECLPNSAEQQNPANPVLFEDDRRTCLQALLSAFHDLDVKFTSSYGSVYAGVHPINVAPTGEPRFTNWTDDFRGTLDYIFYLTQRPTKGLENCEMHLCTPRILQVLRVPEESDMGPEPSSLPRRGHSPSDHVPLLAVFSW